MNDKLKRQLEELKTLNEILIEKSKKRRKKLNKLQSVKYFDLIKYFYQKGYSCQKIEEELQAIGKNVIWMLLKENKVIRSQQNEFTKQRISKAAKERFETADEEIKEAWRSRARNTIPSTVKEIKCNFEGCENLIKRQKSKIKYGKNFCSLGCRNKWRAIHKPEETLKTAIKASRSNKMQDTSIELKLQDELKKRKIPFYKNYPVGGCSLADIYLKEYKTVIYADGVYWHNYPHGLEKDKRVNNRLKKQGFKVFRFWEHEINENPSKCIEKVLKGVGLI